MNPQQWQMQPQLGSWPPLGHLPPFQNFPPRMPFQENKPEEDEHKLANLQIQAQQWQQQKQYQEWMQNQNFNSQVVSKPDPDLTKLINEKLEELNQANKEEAEFDKQYKEWEKQFEQWKEQNKNHPNKEQFKQYEEQWNTWKSQMTSKRSEIITKKNDIQSKLQELKGKEASASSVSAPHMQNMMMGMPPIYPPGGGGGAQMPMGNAYHMQPGMPFNQMAPGNNVGMPPGYNMYPTNTPQQQFQQLGPGAPYLPPNPLLPNQMGPVPPLNPNNNNSSMMLNSFMGGNAPSQNPPTSQNNNMMYPSQQSYPNMMIGSGGAPGGSQSLMGPTNPMMSHMGMNPMMNPPMFPGGVPFHPPGLNVQQHSSSGSAQFNPTAPLSVAPAPPAATAQQHSFSQTAAPSVGVAVSSHLQSSMAGMPLTPHGGGGGGNSSLYPTPANLLPFNNNPAPLTRPPNVGGGGGGGTHNFMGGGVGQIPPNYMPQQQQNTNSGGRPSSSSNNSSFNHPSAQNMMGNMTGDGGDGRNLAGGNHQSGGGGFSYNPMVGGNMMMNAPPESSVSSNPQHDLNDNDDDDDENNCGNMASYGSSHNKPSSGGGGSGFSYHAGPTIYDGGKLAGSDKSIKNKSPMKGSAGGSGGGGGNTRNFGAGDNRLGSRQSRDVDNNYDDYSSSKDRGDRKKSSRWNDDKNKKEPKGLFDRPHEQNSQLNKGAKGDNHSKFDLGASGSSYMGMSTNPFPVPPPGTLTGLPPLIPQGPGGGGPPFMMGPGQSRPLLPNSFGPGATGTGTPNNSGNEEADAISGASGPLVGPGGGGGPMRHPMFPNANSQQMAAMRMMFMFRMRGMMRPFPPPRGPFMRGSGAPFSGGGPRFPGPPGDRWGGRGGKGGGGRDFRRDGGRDSRNNRDNRSSSGRNRSRSPRHKNEETNSNNDDSFYWDQEQDTGNDDCNDNFNQANGSSLNAEINDFQEHHGNFGNNGKLRADLPVGQRSDYDEANDMENNYYDESDGSTFIPYHHHPLININNNYNHNRDHSRFYDSCSATNIIQDRQHFYSNSFNDFSDICTTKPHAPPTSSYDAASLFKKRFSDVLALNPRTKILIIMRGVPGSGKSHMAKVIKEKVSRDTNFESVRLFSIDDYFLDEANVYHYEPEMEESYISSLEKSLKKCLTTGTHLFCVMDSVNHKLSHFEDVALTALENGYQVFVCEIMEDLSVCAQRNIHSRPKDDIEQIACDWELCPASYIILDSDSILPDPPAGESKISSSSGTTDTSIVLDSKNAIVPNCPPRTGMKSFDDAHAFKPIPNIREEDDTEANSKNASQSALSLNQVTSSSTPSSSFTSRWDSIDSESKLDKLDGLKTNRSNKGTRHGERIVQSIEDFLREAASDYSNMDESPGKLESNSESIGKKKVRWADIEEAKDQAKMRAVGFVVGKMDWKKITDDQHPMKALNKTKYI